MSSFEEVKQVQVDLEKLQKRLENEMDDNLLMVNEAVNASKFRKSTKTFGKRNE